MADKPDTSWPEQDIIRTWLEKHRIDLPHEVTFELAQRMTELRQPTALERKVSPRLLADASKLLRAWMKRLKP